MIGVDISDFSMEAVQLSGQYGKSLHRLKSWSRTAVPEGAMKAGRIIKTEEVQEALRVLLSKPTFGNMDGKQVICSVLEHHCYHNIIPLSKWTSDKPIFAQIQEALNGKIPFNIGQVYWDWRPVREDNRLVYVYTVAIPRDIVDSYRAAFENLGMNIMFMEPQILCAARSLWRGLVQDAPSLLIDIGARETSIATIDDLGIHQASMVPIGADHWQDALAKQLSQPAENAQKILRTLGMRRVKHPNAEVIYGILEKGLEQIIQDTKQHTLFYNTQTHIQPGVLKQLVVVGGGAAVPGVTEYLSHKLSLATDGHHPWFELKPALGSTERLLLSSALGAAVRGLMSVEEQTSELNIFATRRVMSPTENGGWKQALKKLLKKKVT